MSRSKAYPTADLAACVEHAQQIWDEHERKQLTLEEATQALGYKGVSGPSRSKISAMKQYGLLDEGAGNAVKLSKRAIDILHKPAGDPARAAALRDAVHDVEIFKRLLASHADASVGAVSSHLLTEDGFTKVGADRAAKSFLESIKFAGIGNGDTLSGSNGDKDESVPGEGDWVQWTSQGVAQFAAPRLVKGFSEDGQFAFVEGTQTGIPMGELTKELPPSPEVRPPPNPFASAGQGQAETPPAGSKQDVFTLDSGESVTARWPDSITPDDFTDIKEWFKILERKIGRSVHRPDYD
ncbi:MAG: hypothetical protein RIB60_05710 [Phycisphaerales bacterium]